MRASSAPSSRILAFQFHAGCSGQCVLDGFGLAPDGWKNSRTATRTPEDLVRFVRRAVKRFRPSAVVLGITRRNAVTDESFRHTAVSVLRALRVPVVVRHMREAYALFRGRIRGTRREELARTIAVNFLPECSPGLTSRRVRDRRSAWQALALALVELVHRFPRSAAALARSSAFSIRPFHAALIEAETAQHRDPV